MQKADEYRLRAAECLALALNMPRRSEKEQLRNMANIWESLASEEEAGDLASWAPPASVEARNQSRA